jgi:hypothetical protein
MLGIPKFNDVQNILKRIFFKKEGLIYIVTEDKKEDQVFYNLLLNRLSDQQFKIISVTSIGSRANVMKRSFEDKNPQVPTLYIIDGDIDLIMKEPVESSNLIGLDRYCIENYLCCEQGLISLLMTNYGDSKGYYESRLEFRNTINNFCFYYQKIAIRYYISQQLECNTGFKKASDFFFIRKGGVFKVNKQAVNAEIKRVEDLIKNKLKQQNIKAFAREMNRMIKEAELKNQNSLDNYLKVLSGKDFLFPILERKLKIIEGRLAGWSLDQLKRQLAERIDISTLHRVKLKMRSVVK